jgi:hypothetical protein
VWNANPISEIVLVALIATAGAQTGNRNLPRFDQYAVSDIFKGKPAAPKLIRPADKLFRTRIREGAAAGPNFAGHFTIAEWGCGSACVSVAVVNAKTGDVYDGPFGILGYGQSFEYADRNEEPLSYKLDSRLLKVRGCGEDRDCAEFFYEWTGNEFKLVLKIAAVQHTPGDTDASDRRNFR